MKAIFRRLCLSAAALAVAVAASAEAPANYYTSADGKSGDALRMALHDIISDHNILSYKELWYIYEATDTYDDGTVWDMYSTCSWTYEKDQCGNYKNVCDCYNREHSVPKSWFNDASPMYTDAFHLYPTDGKVNGERSNHPFGECANGKTFGSNGLGRLGSSTFSGYSGTVFEPDDEYKGDFARTYFYMATRYADRCSGWKSGEGSAVFSSANCGLTDYAVALFMKWHREDPVSEKERIRNDAIYGIDNSTGYKQGNRNPFIDYPCLAEYIWGNRKGAAVDFSMLTSSYSPGFDDLGDRSGCNCDETYMEYVEQHDITCYQRGNELHVFNLTPEETVSIYSINGITIERRTDCSREETFTLPTGMYILVAGDRHIKIIIR